MIEQLQQAVGKTIASIEAPGYSDEYPYLYSGQVNITFTDGYELHLESHGSYGAESEIQWESVA